MFGMEVVLDDCFIDPWGGVLGNGGGGLVIEGVFCTGFGGADGGDLGKGGGGPFGRGFAVIGDVGEALVSSDWLGEGRS